MGNKISSSQFWLLATTMTITFKLNNFASLIYEGYNTTTVVVFAGYCLFDFFVALGIYRLAKRDFFSLLTTKRRLVLSLLLTAFYVIKMLANLSMQVAFCKNYLVTEMPVWLIYLIALVTAVMLSKFKMNSLARTNEITLPIVAFMLLINMVFLRVETNFDYLSPLFSKYNAGYNGAFRYFAWSLDSLPLLTCKVEDRKDNKEKKAGQIAYFFGMAFALTLVVVGQAIYGGAFKDVDNLYVKIGVFNDYSLQLGRLDWIGIICWQICAVVTVGAQASAVRSSVNLFFKSKKVPYLVFLGVYVLLAIYFVEQKTTTALTLNYFGYVCFFTATIAFLLMIVAKLRGNYGKKDIKE